MQQRTVATYLAQRLASAGSRHVFMVTGGGAMFPNDALCHHPELSPVFFHHEQAAAMYQCPERRLRCLDRFGAMIVISGQVKRATCLATTPLPGLRQLGDQACEIIPIVRGITKYASIVERPENVAWHLDQAIHLATARTARSSLLLLRRRLRRHRLFWCAAA